MTTTKHIYNQRNNKNQNKLKPIYITKSPGKVLV